ncbi:DUF1648 domain-containing protein [Clostridium estertheticum]|uniref:DUF1648 domain-containing protein n=1 Tax=Clostridium estertheticum TaxID=238834 RepID=UPI0013E94917|nr:DUF1648 domain-containing protein [Clostridium estertheticum]MBZ9689257.1 DUF1648 domain-containing protein [Clostridium estertheticum]
MKINIKDILILIIPVVISILLIPVLPDKIPMQWSLNGTVNWYLDKKFSFIIGIFPFVVYELIKLRHK